MKRKPYQSVEVKDKKYWDYNFKIGGKVYEISVDKETGEIFVTLDPMPQDPHEKGE